MVGCWLNELIVCFYVVCSLEKEDFLENLHILFCFVQLKSILFNLLCVLDFFQNAGSQLCFRFFSPGQVGEVLLNMFVSTDGREVFTRGRLYEQRISPLITFIFHPLFKVKKTGIYEVHLGLSSQPIHSFFYV